MIEVVASGEDVSGGGCVSEAMAVVVVFVGQLWRWWVVVNGGWWL